MKKPEKIKGVGGKMLRYHVGFNQACDDWEKYYKTEKELSKQLGYAKGIAEVKNSLPSEEEIYKLIGHAWVEDNEIAKRIAKAIHKRIRGGVK